MANVTVHSTIMLNTGELVDLSATLTEGTEGELTTSTTYSVSAVSLGQFADGKTITPVLLPVTAPNGGLHLGNIGLTFDIDAPAGTMVTAATIDATPAKKTK